MGKKYNYTKKEEELFNLGEYYNSKSIEAQMKLYKSLEDRFPDIEILEIANRCDVLTFSSSGDDFSGGGFWDCVKKQVKENRKWEKKYKK